MSPLAAFLLAPLFLSLQSGDTLTLPQAISLARAARPLAAGAAAMVERARGARSIAAAIPNPSAQFESDQAVPTRKLLLVQPLAWLPRRGADLAAGRAVVTRAAADSAQLLADLARDVRRAFFTSLAADERLRLMEEQAGIADTLVVLADRRVSGGDISLLERDQVAQEASLSRLTAAQARESARAARIDLGRAVAWSSVNLPRAVGQLGQSLDDHPTIDTVRGAEALDDLPTVRAAQAEQVVAAARLRVARVAQIPIPSLVVGREWGNDPLTRDNAIVGFALPFPLFSQGREGVAEARGALGEAAARAAEARLTLAAELASARIHVAETRERARFARDSLVAEARRIRAGAVRLYESGRTGILPVFDAIRAEREVAQTLVQALLDFQRARADLVALLGRLD